MWEVDPETKSKLLALQKRPQNASCVDCTAAGPQWASPKFGTFICLECAGIHRGLGVHVSFVRSVQMDSFKVNEVRRMEEGGGNEAWRKFWDAHEDGGNGDSGIWGRTGVGDRYEGFVGEEWKERLGARVEGREVRVPERKARGAPGRSGTGGSGGGSGKGTPLDVGSGRNSPARSGSPAIGGAGIGGGQKGRNEAYFAKMGEANKGRPEDLPPSQGGKYAGFGSGFEPEKKKGGGGGGGGGGAMPGVDEFQKDPVAALTKGFGWFTTTVGKQAKTVNEGWIQPNVQKLNESDLAAQARVAAANAAANMQKGAKGAADQFNKFVEGDEGRSKVAPEKKDFWDSFGEPAGSSSTIGTQSLMGGGAKKSNAVGTAAMKKRDGKDEGWGDDF